MSADQSNHGDSQNGFLAIPLRVLAALASGLILFMLLIMVLDVSGRSLLNKPIGGAVELVEIALAGVIFCCLPVVAWREEHITADLFDEIIGSRGVVALRFISSLLASFVFAWISWEMWRLAARATRFRDATPVLGIPVSWIIGSITVLCAVTALVSLVRALLIIAGHSNSRL